MPKKTLSSQSKSIQSNAYGLRPFQKGQQNQQTVQSHTSSAHGNVQHAQAGIGTNVQQSIQQAEEAMHQARQAIDHVVSQGMQTPQQILRQAQQQLQEAHRQINETQQEINYILQSLH